MIRNVIATADLKQQVNAPKFTEYPWGIYDLQYYGGRCGYVKDKTIQGKVTIFISGKMISTGAHSVKASINQLEMAMILLVKNDFIKKVKLKPKIENIVATLNLNTRIDLNEVAKVVPKITYEPDQFPAAIIRMAEGPVCLLFVSGKIVIVGSKSEKALAEVEVKIENLLKPFNIK
jgi:TATA-box binding protein (TBP) (component of TFIID and TFIIIB)